MNDDFSPFPADDFSGIGGFNFSGDGFSDFGVNEPPALETSDTIDAPLIVTTRHRKTVILNAEKQEALDRLIQELPHPDDVLWIISNGMGASYKFYQETVTQFEFGHFIATFARLLGHGTTAYLSTWTMNRYHAQNILDMLDDGRLAHVMLCTDPYWKRRESAVSTALIAGLIARNQRYVAFPNHTKIMAMASADGQRACTIFSSANFSAQPRAENFTLSTNVSLYHAVVNSFFEAIAHKIKESKK